MKSVRHSHWGDGAESSFGGAADLVGERGALEKGGDLALEQQPLLADGVPLERPLERTRRVAPMGRVQNLQWKRIALAAHV